VRPQALLRAAALGGLFLLAPASATSEARPVEVEVEVPDGPGARRAAADAALAEAVARVAESLVQGVPLGDASWSERLGEGPARFALRYEVATDLGERPHASGPALHAFRVEVAVDATALEHALAKRGFPLRDRSTGVARTFLLELRSPVTWPAIARLRNGIAERGGSSVPHSFSAAGATLVVEAPGGPDALLERLLDRPIDGLHIEPVHADDERLALRIALPDEPGSEPSETLRVDPEP
jgi:hypothetical protein